MTKKEWYQSLQKLSHLKKELVILISEMNDSQWQGCDSRNSITGETTRLSVIFPCFIASELLQELPNSVYDSKLASFVLKMNNWLVKQSKTSLFSYWELASVNHINRPYPFDLDDTMGAWSALCISHKNNFLRNWPILVQNLALIYEKNFLFRTWFVPKTKDFSSWQDIDPVANCNAQSCLAKLGIQSEKSHKSLAKLLNKGVKSPYYPNSNVEDFFFSRMYSQIDARNQKLYLKRRASVKKLPSSDSILDSALNIASRCLLGKIINVDEVDNLTQLFYKTSQQSNVFCLDLQNENETSVCDSLFLTYACVLYSVHLVEKQILLINPLKTVQNVVPGDRICLFLQELPYQLLLQKYKRPLSQSELMIAKRISDFCGRAHLFVTKVDHHYDSRKSNIGKKNVLQLIRETNIKSYAKRACSLDFFEKQMGLLLQSYKHKPKSTTLAQRYVGLIEQVYRLCYGKTSLSGKLKIGLKQCFIALQLADDLHDWESDYKQLIKTPIVIRLRNKIRRSPKYNRVNLELRKYFWSKIYLAYSEKIFVLLDKSLKNLSEDLPVTCYTIQWIFGALSILNKRDLEARTSLILMNTK